MTDKKTKEPRNGDDRWLRAAMDPAAPAEKRREAMRRINALRRDRYDAAHEEAGLNAEDGDSASNP